MQTGVISFLKGSLRVLLLWEGAENFECVCALEKVIGWKRCRGGEVAFGAASVPEPGPRADESEPKDDALNEALSVVKG